VHRFPRGVLWSWPRWYSAMRYVAIVQRWVREHDCRITHSNTEAEEIWKGIFEFCCFETSPLNVYYHAVPCMCRVCTNVWVLKFGSYSVSMQQVNRIVIDMFDRWQWLPKTVYRYEGICSCLQSV